MGEVLVEIEQGAPEPNCQSAAAFDEDAGDDPDFVESGAGVLAADDPSDLDSEPDDSVLVPEAAAEVFSFLMPDEFDP